MTKSKSTAKKKKEVRPPQTWVEGNVSAALIHVDSLLDRISTNKLRTFDVAIIEQLRKLNKADLKIVSSHYTRTVDDLKLALKGDEFCLEAYSNFSKPQMKVAIDTLTAVSKLKPDVESTGKKIRLGNHGPRKHKVKPPEEMIKKVLYLDKDQDTGMISQSPETIIGANEMWVYNRKNKKLGCYYSAKGLSIKGTTVLEYDLTQSYTKKLRKPKMQLREFMGGKMFDEKAYNWMQQYWKRIRSVTQPISPRLNRETLILKINHIEN